ncbi:MAG TPA: DUF1624 domain-containing protein [Papillibacter sp.]|jgi:uncharacterized membrane protein|nr:DUF1624 domain-containing protein [Papillibacter sp.]
MTAPANPRRRIDLIDALRGLAVVLMVMHHFAYDLVVYAGAPVWLFTNPVIDIFHYIFAGLFIFLSGVSSRFSRSNIKRGLKVLIAALVISIVTHLPIIDAPIVFGILHLLSFCMLFYGLTRRLWDKIPRAIAPILYVALIAGSAIAVSFPLKGTGLWLFGWVQEGFFSADYFPLFPWLFVFLLGTWAGAFVAEGRLPEWFYTFTMPFFPAVGRKSFLVYLIHQPILFGLVQLGLLLFG